MQADFKPGARPTLVLSRRFRQPVEKVWAALTIPERIADWLGVEWMGEPALSEGGPFTYRFTDTDMLSEGKVLKLQPPYVLEHSWVDNVMPGTIVRWELQPDGDGALLTLTNIFPAPEDAPRTAAGWTMILRSLEAHLDGGSVDWGGMNWSAIRDDYAERFGEEASLDGRKVEIDGQLALRFVRILRHSPQAVWDALASPEGWSRWMQAGTSQIEPRVGGRFHNFWPDYDHGVDGEVLAWDPPRHLAFTWPEGGVATQVSFRLEPHELGCRLVMEHVGINAEDAVGYGAGWHWHLDCLPAAIEGRATPRAKTREEALEKAYRATLDL
ncbi:SRPBCC family protein [Caulobacter sp. NIBR2454]|uniref:SRPBCC family protein n=1 Tax=Caulobacter sp. NIBR2454 TaxID=3015996 RepID=UPI0022B62534|nr:SRPBCC family protein [Caulobacter sp. NIBR2454]